MYRSAGAMSTEQERDPTLDETQSAPLREQLATLEEQRHSTRFPREADTEFAAIWRETGEEHLVAVYDESLTGLGLLVDAALELRVGSQLNVVYAGESLQGEIRHVTPHPDGRVRVGLRCRRLEDQSES